MQIITTIVNLRSFLNKIRAEGKTIGFVPTMGALHQGHLSLVQRCKEENDLTVVSIFVNPTQFNNNEDLTNYPRMPEKDATMLELAKVDVLFLPEVEEVYPGNTTVNALISLPENLSGVMEGAFRPGHFNGVMQIVHLLFSIVQPDRSYFGEKDFQQLAVVRFMTSFYRLPVTVVGCPTLREDDGLAMSSRNLRLNNEQRQDAAFISKALFYIRDHWKEESPAMLVEKALTILSSRPSLKVEYLEIADENTLTPLNKDNESSPLRVFAAVYCGTVRLIDNVALY